LLTLVQNPVPHIIQDQTFWVSPERCLFWEEENTLIIADLHLGKTGHFRKAGIAVPQSVYKADLQRLMAMLYLHKAERLIIVGDFTHSSMNKELDLFVKWRKDFSSLRIDLVKGNHDILGDYWYDEAAISVHEHELLVKGFLFRHDDKKARAKEEPACHYQFTGHVHPGIALRGAGRQSLRFPCFYFAKQHCILPAFSRFTGTYTVKAEKGETVYAVTPSEIIRLN
jgi:DNA ligase-associated metallophosphoesterase